MNKRKIFIIILLIIVVLIIGFIIDCSILDTSSKISLQSINELNVNTLSIDNDIVQNVTNELIAKNITEEKAENNSNINDNEEKNVSTTVAKTTTIDNTKNTKTNTSSKSNAQNTEKPKTTTQNKEVSKNTSNKNTATTPVKTDTSNKQTTKEEKIEHPELANKTYTKQNTSVVPEIINILNNEISKDKELVDFGTKAVAGTKANAYKNTTGFTYMFVSDIQKGKVKGNYITFPQRVKNNVGAFGTYYVYAEDEYTYNSSGLDPKWSQTLVWIWVSF